MTRPLEATLVEVFMSIRQLQVPGCCKHDNPELGGYLCGIFSLWLMIEMNKHDFFFGCNTYIGASLKLSLCSPLKNWGLQVLCIYKEEHLQIISFEKIRKINYMTRCQQQLRLDIISLYNPEFLGNDKPASFISSSRLNIRWIFEDQNYLTRRLGSRLKWIILHNIFLWETNIIKLIVKLVYWPGFSRRRKWQGRKDVQVPVDKNS